MFIKYLKVLQHI